MLEQVTRELNVEALPDDDPRRRSQHDVGGHGDRRHDHARAITAPDGRDASRRPRDRGRDADPAAPPDRGGAEIEAETELVGEDGEPREAEEAAEGEAEGGEGEAAEGE